MARKYQQTSGLPGSVVLVVDDSPEVLESTRRLLEKEGHEVYTAPDAHSALEFLKANRVQVIVADYFMPAMTGEELVRAVRDSGDQVTQIILATGYSGEKPARVMMQQLDIQGYHDKSEGAQKLLLWIDTAVKAYRHVSAMEKHRKGLRFILDLTPELHRMQPIDELLEGLLWQVEALLGAENSFVATLASGAPISDPEGELFIAIADSPDQIQELQIRVGTGRYSSGTPVRQLADGLGGLVDEAIEKGLPCSNDDSTVLPLMLGTRAIGVIYLDRKTGYAKDQELLEVFATQAAAAIQNALLYDMATTDPLTGTYMRGFATQQLEHSIKRCIRRNDPLSLLMVDVDRFKHINDEHGHQTGDRALTAVGELLLQMVRDSDVVGRYGGDEFMVVLPDTPSEGAQIVADRILEKARTLCVDADGVTVPIRLSVGLGTLVHQKPEDEIRVDRDQVVRAAENLIGMADRGLYAAKGSGTTGVMGPVYWEDSERLLAG